MERSSLIRYLAVALALLLPAGAGAHKINTSYVNVEIGQDGALEARVSFDETDLLVAFDLDGDGDGMLRRQEMLSGSDTVAAFLERTLKVTAEGDPVELSAGEASMRLDDKGNLFLDVPLRGRLPGDPETLEIRFDLFDRVDPDHRCLVKLQAGDLPGQAVVLHAEIPERQFRLRDPGLLDHVVDFTVLGIEHIFLGYDHLMFLLALIAIGGRPLALVKVVTAFTVAHSITLILAALDVVSLPGRLVEAGIAFSIAYVAAENLWRPRPAHRWRLTFFFGLVHGFGFANVLRELGLPAKSQELIASCWPSTSGWRSARSPSSPCCCRSSSGSAAAPTGAPSSRGSPSSCFCSGSAGSSRGSSTCRTCRCEGRRSCSAPGYSTAYPVRPGAGRRGRGLPAPSGRGAVSPQEDPSKEPLSSDRVLHLGEPLVPVARLGPAEWWEGRSRAACCGGVSSSQ